MALVIENGTVVAGANSFATVAQLRAFANLRGVVLPVADADVEILLVKAADFICSKNFIGNLVSISQPLCWPRANAYISQDLESPYLLPSNEVPAGIVRAQCQLAIDALSTDLMPNGDGKEVVREKVDVLEVEYAKSGTGVSNPVLQKAEALLSIFYKTESLFTGLRSIRA